MKVRSSSRGLKITSLVVLSPVLLILFSLVYIFLVFIYSNIMSWCHPTIQPLSSQSSLSRVATSSTVSIYHHHCSSKLPQLTILKRVNFFSRLRQSPLVWCVILLIYALYTFHKKKKDNNNNEDDPDLFYQVKYAEEPVKPNTKQHKRKKTKNKQHHPKSSSTEQQRHSKPIRSYSPVKTPELESDDDDNDNNIWISVGEIRKKKHNKARNVHKAVFETVVSSDKYQDHEDEMNETMEQHDHQNNDDSINDDSDVHCDDKLNDDKDDYTTSDDMNSTASPEDEDSSVDLNSLTPITSEDESEPLIERKRRSWYSPFSTGLDLDILQKRPDPFATHYKFDSFMLPPPISSSFKSNIELLQNHPFIPTSKQQQVQHTLGPIGDSIRPSFVHF